MPIQDPFVGAKSEREEAGRQLLATIAQSGQAGKEAWKAGIDEANSMRQGALSRAQQRAALTGQNLAGEDVAAVGEAADRYNTYFTGEEAAMQGRLGEIGASGQSYLAKVGAIAPFMQQKAIQQAAERENQYKMEVAQNQAKIDADKAAEDREHLRQIELLNLRNRFDVQADQRSTAAKAPAAPKLPKLEELMAGAQTVTDLQHAATPNNRLIDTHPQLSEVLMSAADKAAYNKTDYKTEVAKALGEVGYNLTPTQINTIFYKSDSKANQDATATTYAKKYASKGVTYDLAKSVLGNELFHNDVQWIFEGADGMTQDEAEAVLRQFYLVDRKWPSEYHILVDEYVKKMLPKE